MKHLLLVLVLLVISCKISFSAENIAIETRSADFFENIISDTLLLLDPELKKIIADDFAGVVAESVFILPANSWTLRPKPKARIQSIIDNMNNDNIKMSFALLVKPVLELACVSQQWDPTNELWSKCMTATRNYPIIEPILIDYTYQSSISDDRLFTELTGLNSSNRYQQMVHVLADIMNSAYAKIHQKTVDKSVKVIKYPLLMVGEGSRSGSAYSSSSATSSKCLKPHVKPSTSGYDYDLIEYKHCLDLEKIQAGGSLTPSQYRASSNGFTQQDSSPKKDVGICMGACSNEQGLCISQCGGNGQCIGNCAAAQGRCTARCTQ